MTISQETKNLILEIANRQMKSVGNTSCDTIMYEMLDKTLDDPNIEIPDDFDRLSYKDAKKAIASILAQAHASGELIADYILYPNPTYHKKLEI